VLIILVGKCERYNVKTTTVSDRFFLKANRTPFPLETALKLKVSDRFRTPNLRS
jgi:hypothetical protein